MAVGQIGTGNRQFYGVTGRKTNTNKMLEDAIFVQSSQLPSLYAAKESKRRAEEVYDLEEKKLGLQAELGERELALLRERSDAEIASNEKISADKLATERQLSEERMKQEKASSEKAIDQAEDSAAIGQVIGGVGTVISGVTAAKQLGLIGTKTATTAPVAPSGLGEQAGIWTAESAAAADIGAATAAGAYGTEAAGMLAFETGGAVTSVPTTGGAGLMGGGVMAAAVPAAYWAGIVLAATTIAGGLYGKYQKNKYHKSEEYQKMEQAVRDYTQTQGQQIATQLQPMAPEERTTWAGENATKFMPDSLYKAGLNLYGQGRSAEEDAAFQTYDEAWRAAQQKDVNPYDSASHDDVSTWG